MARKSGRRSIRMYFDFALWAMQRRPGAVPSAVEIAGFMQINLDTARKTEKAWRESLAEFGPNSAQAAATGSAPPRERASK